MLEVKTRLGIELKNKQNYEWWMNQIYQSTIPKIVLKNRVAKHSAYQSNNLERKNFKFQGQITNKNNKYLFSSRRSHSMWTAWIRIKYLQYKFPQNLPHYNAALSPTLLGLTS